MSRRIWLFGGAALWLLAACSDSTATPTVARVTVTPPAPTLAVGEILTLSALALDGSGSVVEGREASWSSSSPAVANVTAGGIVTAVAAGTVVIRATVDDRYGEAMLTVRPAPVARVVIEPSNLTVAIGASLPLTAKAFDAAGHELHGRAITWMSSDASIADVDDSGKVAGRRVGVAIVTATVENKVAEATLAVVVPRVPVDSIRVSPAPVVLDVGRTRQLTAFVFDAEGNRLTDRVVTWTTDAPLVAGVSANGLVSAFGPGYATIVATSEGKTFGVAITVTEGELDAMPYDLVYHRMSPGVVGEIVIMGTAYGAAPMRVNAGTASRSPSPSPTGNRVAFYVGRFEPNGDRTREVIVAQEILQTMGLRSFTPMVSACPGCGRTTSAFFQELADKIHGWLRAQMPAWRERYHGVENMTVAVMGCVVNGPGESKMANIGISLPGTSETPVAPVFVDGQKTVTLKGDRIAEEFQDLMEAYVARRFARRSAS